MAGLQNNLADLHACLQGDDPASNAHKAHNIAGDIGHYCLQDVTDKDIDYTCSLLFAKDTGAVTFLRKAVRQDEYQSAKVELVDILRVFTTKWPAKVVPYAVDIKDACVALFTRDKYSKVKSISLTLLIEVIKHVPGSKVAGDMDVKKLIEKFFLELTQATKHSATVKQPMYHLLGLLAEVFPEESVNYSERLVDTYVRTMKTEMTSKTRKPELPIISGCLQGLTHYLVNFTQSADEGAKHAFSIYKATKMAISKDIQHTRFELPRAGLALFTKHAPQFNLYIIDDYEMLYDTLKYWSGHHNKDMLHAGTYAMEALLAQVSETLVSRAKEGKREGGIFKFFIQKFRDIMDNPDASNKEVSLAIRGYGLFAAPCKIFLSTKDVHFMFNEMMQRSDQLFFDQTGVSDDRLMSLPSYLDALASITQQLDEVSETFLWSLERLVVVLMESVPKLNAKMHYSCYLSLLRVLHALMPKGAVFRVFLARVVYQSVIRTCSHPVVLVTEETALETVTESEVTPDDKPAISYRSYLDMWTALLSSSRFKDLMVQGVSVEERVALTELLYAELMAAVLKVLSRLDLGSQREEDMDTDGDPDTSGGSRAGSPVTVTSDPVSGLHASKPKDFIVFINLVDFCRDLLPHQLTHLFKSWVFKFGHELILYSTKYPLVSGFYKLLGVCMTICTKTAYFKDLQKEDDELVKMEVKKEEEEDSESMEVDPSPGEVADRSQRESCFLLFSKFAKEVMTRLKQYKDDLLSSCLTFVLSLPPEIVSAEVASIVPALQMALRLGVSYLTLALVGLDALEQWKHSLPQHVIRPYYSQILPCLDPYLKTNRDKDADKGGTLSLTSKGTSKKAGKKKIPIKLLRQTKRDAVKSEDTQLAQVQQRCVSLLGSLGGRTNHLLMSSSAEHVSQQAVAWDNVQHLKFDMPFMDIKPVIYFDPFLPRIAELATTSGERQTKVAACELLHSLVLYMVGRGVQRPATGTHREPMEKLYRRLFPVIVTLACDVEQVAKQLFEPLMLQMIHWFTGNKRYESEETMALLDTLIDGIVDPSDTARRDFSAKCLKEFLVWSIKQTSKKQMEKSPFNIKSLLKRLYSLAHHPSAFKRLGAALAFNSIYPVFREEDSLVDMFTFQLLVNYIESLALAHNDDRSLGTQEQCRQVLTHLERIIKHKAALLSKPSKYRVIPREWNDATLLTAVRWLIRQCGRPHTECRHAAMQLIFNLAPCVQHIKTPHDFFTALQKESGPEYFIVRFERGRYKLQSRSGLVQCPTMARLGDAFTVKLAVSWYDILLATLDCYTWVFGQSLLSPAKTLVVSGNKGTVLFQVLTHFLEELALEDVAGAARLFKESPNLLLFTPHERDEYNRIKCTAIIRLLDYIVVLLGVHMKDSLKVIPGSFWSDNLWELIVMCVLQPTKVGFNMADVEVMMKLPEQMSQVLQVINRLPANVSKGFFSCLKMKLAKGQECDLSSKLPLSLARSDENQLDLLHLVRGLTQLQTLRLLDTAIAHVGDLQKFSAKLLQSIFNSVVVREDDHLAMAQLSPRETDLATAILQLTFVIGLKPKAILDVLLDKTQVRHAGSGSSGQGTLFLARFGPTLNLHLVTVAADFLPALVYHAREEPGVVGSVLSGMLDKASKERNLRKKEGKGLVKLVLAQWSQLSCWWSGTAASQETKLQALAVLTKVIVVDSKVVVDPELDTFGSVFDMYLDLLTDKDTSLAFKSRVLDLLVFFVSLPDREIKKLKSRFDRLVADNFPMKSSEFAVGSPKHSDYITALNKLLSALDLSGSLMLLELLISVMCREAQHAHEDEMQSTLTRFIKRLPMDKHKPAIDVPYAIFRKEGSFPDAIRRAALERVCLPLLRTAHKGALSEFFSDHIKEIMATLDTKFNKNSEDTFRTQLISKICALELLEVMYSRLPKDDVFSKTSQINATYCNQRVDSGKELTTTITKMANQAKSEDCRGESVCVDLRRQYHCAAYNTLIATISCTQTDAKFYNGFLFNENLAKGQFLLDNIIDDKKEYQFEVEMEALHERKKRFVSIRNEVREGRSADEEEGEPETTSVHYLASQYLADSSLSTEVSQFDFGSSAATASFSGSAGGDRRTRIKKSSSAFDEPKVTVEADYVEMEMDELNQHECMATLTALIQHMRRNKITPETEKGVSPSSMPTWMDNLHKKMKHHSTSINVKLFLAKLIINTEEVFRPYARFWIAPLVHLLVTGETRNPGIHYFVVDIVVTVLSWHTVAIPEDTAVDRGMASSLLEFLLKNGHNDNRRILRNNLDVIKTLVEVWQDRLDIPHKLIYDNFSQADKGNRNGTGIQMLGVILANKLPPYSSTCGVNKDRFFQHLAMNMMNTHKAVYAAAAEVVGLALRHLSERERTEADKEWQEGYVGNIAKMLLSIQTAKPDVFITCVYKMQLHHPSVVDKFISNVLFLLPRLHGDFRNQCLEIITSRAEHIDNIFTEMRNKNLVDLLTHRDEGCQLVTLKLVKVMLPKVKAEELLSVLPSVGAFSTHTSAACRAVMYDILTWIYDNYREEDTEMAHKIMSATKDGLLVGLSDEDLKNRLTIQNFWSHETRLPTATVDRMVAMLEAMYSPRTETEYLAYATNLLLEMTSKSPDYNRAIYEHPLSECHFEDYNVTSSWRQRHAAMTPLFVATQMSQTQGGDTSFGDVTMMTGQVRATQDVVNFTPTQQPGASKGPYNWLTQSSLDTYSDYNLTLPPTEDSQSSLLFTVGKGPGPSRRGASAGPGPGFGRGRAGAGRDEGHGAAPGAGGDQQGKGSDILRLKKRFVKDHRGSAQLYFAKKNARMKQLREEVRKEQKARRENMVTMYRKYRAGDLPDIQIKYSYVIAPLQALAQADQHIGRLLFGSLFKSIFPEIEKVKTDREAREMIDQITASLNAMLNNSTQYCPAFIACVLDIALGFPRRLKLEPNVVNTACLTAQQQPLGIVLLEETLIFGTTEEVGERPAKRARGAASTAANQLSKDTATWIELARLYKSLGDYDVLQGIFSSKVGTQELTQRAMEEEMKKDYKAALKLYNEGLTCSDWGDDPPPEAELDLWDTSRLQCCADLTDWNKLEEYTTTAVDESTPPKLDLVWTDTYFQEHYLPFIVRGRLKLLMEGDDQQALLDLVDRALLIPERKALLESSYCEELGLLYTWQQDYDRARHFSHAAISAFLQEWGSLNALMETSRSVSLQRLQKLTELSEFLAFMAKDSNFQSLAPATQLVHKWLRRSPHPMLDSTTTWDDIVTNRCVYLDHMSSRLEAAGVKDDPEVMTSDPWGHHKVSLWLGQANSARQQDNFVVALKQIRKAHKVVKASGDDTLLLGWADAYAHVHVRRAQVAPLSADDRLRAAVAAFDQLEKHRENKLLAHDTRLGSSHYMLKGLAVREMTAVLQDALNMTDFDKELQNKLTAAAKRKDENDVEEVIRGLVEQGFQHLKLAVGITQQGEEAGTARRDVTTSGDDAHMAFVRYCDHYVQQATDDDYASVKCASFDQFQAALVTSLLTSMRHGSVEARQRFPRLLQVVETSPDTIDVFIKKAKQVPCWMFLGWVSQLTAVLDKAASPAVHDMLIDIATNYPNALVYPFKLSDDGYNFPNTPIGKKSKSVRDKLDEMLSKNKLVNAFISALEQFGQPNAIFKDWYEDMVRMLSLKPGQRKTAKIVEEFRQMYADLMDRSGPSEDELYDTQPESSSSQAIPSRVAMGRYRRKFAEKHAARVEKLCGKDGKKLVDISSKSFREEINKILQDMNEVAGSTLKPPGTLREYSQWLSDFQAANFDQDLELPGQYSGLSKPLPEYHVRINSFDERVLVMSSIRKPKRITIRGNDEKDYMFLVKGGEDLRQDQRIEQLFALMNDVFTHDATCRQRKYHVRTYQVIPMTSRVGMIEWMKKTMPLKDFLQSAMTPQEKNFYDSTKGPQADHHKFISGSGKENYFWSYENHSRTDVVNAFRRREEMVPWDLSRRAYQKLSASPEAYFRLRSNLAVSHALISVCQYLLGIGDRHTSNFMVDLATGCMVGIDFGHAFGSATQFLPIPELMPLRLTRQIRNLLKPLREKGLIEGTMVHALRALRNNSDLLLATMDVFIKEPSLDWQQNADRQRRIQGIKDDSDLDTDWYPKQKVSFAQRKLQGHHPTYITRDELALGHKKNKAYKYLERVLMGDKDHDIRARLPARGLSVQQQVACLLNQATDPNILGRVYVGWNSWM